MAKLGEGDPRWIVQQRQDGKNVNSWHWEEKDITPWSRTRLKELLEKSTFFDSPSLKCRTTFIDKCEGDVTVYNRKGKIYFVMELHVIIFCEGEQIGSDGKVISEGKGKITLPELEHDNDPAKVDVNVEVTSDTNDKAFSKILKTEGVKFIRSQLGNFFADLKEGQKVESKLRTQIGSPVQKPAEPTSPSVFDVTEISQRLQWRVDPAEIWECLTNEGRISAYTRSPASVNLKPGGEFSFLGRTITGCFTEVIAGKLLKMKWRLHDWAEGALSEVTISLNSVEHGTTDLRLSQTGIPKNELERTKQGWERNFWEPIKMIFGYGYELQ